QEVVPDYNSRRLFVKVDYYQKRIDSDSKVESGIDFTATYIFPLSLETGNYETGIHIPPYEETILADYSKLVFHLPYDFLGISRGGWFFFMIATEDGFELEMLQPVNQRILRRKIPVNHRENLYHSMALSDAGLLSALLVEKDAGRVVWWRSDLLSQ
ncbi:MAG: hypothetical protein IJR49_06495, partial [Treponema sp.]|nr:hypothetical protein [Treponema sp.]